MTSKFIIGREGHIILKDQSVSRHHAELTLGLNDIHLKDLNSLNGIFLVKNHRLIRFYHGFVQLNQLVLLGGKQYSIQQLIGLAHQSAA